MGRTLPSASSGQALSDAFDVAFDSDLARCPCRDGRIRPSAFDLDLDLDLDSDFAQEGHALSRAASARVLKGRGFKPRRTRLKIVCGFSR